ncbi:CoA ester lyase [Diaminobutyricimonas sp. LJ205]|uniref:HpcH/HpaI aldolase/citrate lyase family protein n=1 Tax=Diaminobutyricimonas sp. LJ205 TaxID=2683590 RepID=UPI00271559F6|nr:CoA ester lyase [Diaminobutyricimonas sp. LJ205]
MIGPALLFCPADRPDRYEKALAAADAVIIDLEDAVAPENRPAARAALMGTPIDPARTIVRVNPIGSADFESDLAALANTEYDTVMLPKADSAAALERLEEYEVIALCETAAGVLAAPDLAAIPNVIALMWGAEDLVASLGGTGTRHPDGSYRALAVHARSSVLLAAGAHGKSAIDTVHLDIADVAGLAAEAEDAAASGFAASACIHPSQVDVIRAAYRPDEAAVAEARELLEQARTHSGVFTFRGRMVDEPLLRHARAVLARAAAIPGD